MNWIKEDFLPDSDTLIIALSSFFNRKDKDNNIWEWDRSTGLLSTEIPFKRMFVKDVDETWYQTPFEGVDGYGPHALAKFLKERIKASGAKRVLMIGLSLGGYGALLLGCLCRVDLSMAISPQTCLLESRYKKNNLHEKFKPYNVNVEETNLKIILDRYNNNYTKYNLYYGILNETDSKMVRNVSDCNGVVLFPYNSAKHTVVDLMKNDGTIRKTLLNFIQKGER